MDPLLMTANQIGAEVIDDLVKLAIEESGYKQRLNFLQKSVEKSQRELQKTKEEAQRIEEERIEIEEQEARNVEFRANINEYQKEKEDVADKTVKIITYNHIPKNSIHKFKLNIIRKDTCERVKTTLQKANIVIVRSCDETLKKNIISKDYKTISEQLEETNPSRQVTINE